MRKAKLAVIGHGRHGKDSVCRILRQDFGLRFISSSLYCAERVVRPALAEQGIIYPSLRRCYADRHSNDNRRLWHEAIAKYNEHDAARLSREIMAEYDVYCGLRSKRELLAAKEERIFDFVLWVDRSKLLPPELASSISITQEMADLTIDNNGDYSALLANVRDFASKHLGKK